MAFGLPERVEYDRALTEARNQLEETTFRAAWDAGWVRTIVESLADVKEVLALARSQPTAAKMPTLTEGTGLTAREIEVLRLVAQGRSNREIADALFIRVPTVKRHITNVLGKLRLPSRSAATAHAHTHGLL
jgi:DNA-binding NarL/FixJ family response regulator